MFLIVLATISIALTILAYCVKRTTIGIGAAFSWLLLALHSYSLSVTIWDMYFNLFWFGIGIMLAIAIESVGMRIGAIFGREEREKEEKSNNNNHKSKKEEPTTIYLHPVDKMRARHKLPPSEARERRTNNRRFYGN